MKDIKAAVAKKTGVPADKQQLFWHQKELTAAHDHRTLLDMHLHTGFSLRGYDLVSLPYTAMHMQWAHGFKLLDSTKIAGFGNV